MLLVNRPYKKDWLISKWMRHEQCWPGFPHGLAQAGLAGTAERTGTRGGLSWASTPTPFPMEARLSNQQLARVQDPFPLQESPPSALPAPKLDTTTLDIRLSGLLVQHDLWSPHFPCPRPMLWVLALPSSWDLTTGSGGARPAAPGAIWVTELCLAAK